MRVLYFHQHFSTPSGAAGTRSYEFAQKLVSKGHHVTLVCGGYNLAHTGLRGEFVGNMRHGDVDGIDVIEFRLPYSNHQGLVWRSWVFFRFALRSINVAIRSDYDLVFATSTPLTAGIPAIVSRLFRRKPFVFEVRDLWPELPRQMGVIRNPVVLWMLSLLEKVSYRAADGCIGLSPGIADGIRRVAGSEKAIRMIPNGCDLDLFRPASERRERPEFKAIFAGTHGLANGLDAVLDAENPQGEGSRAYKNSFFGDGKAKQALVSRARREGLDNVTFRDPLPKRTLVAEFQAADIGLQVLANVPGFYYGTSPNKFFDYLSSGLPIITNYPGWIADLVSQSKCGMAVPPGDASAFADALIELAENPDERRVFGRNARILAEQSFDREILADQFVSFLEEILTA